ncbi:MAG: BatD family protein [Bacteroidales bacterium]
MKRICFLIIPLLLLSHSILAKGEKLKVYAKPQAELGEVFTVHFTIDKKTSSFNPPTFKNLDVVSGPSNTSQSSISIINGKMEQSVTTQITYMVTARSVGVAEVGSSYVMADNKKYESSPVKIKITKPNSSNATNNRNNNSTTADSSNQDLFIKATVDKTSPYLGEQVIITYKIYTQLPVSNYEFIEKPDFAGFWTRDLNENGKLQRNQETINGKTYATGVLLQQAIFPQKSGKIKLNPAKLDVIAQIKQKKQRRRSNNPFDDFFDDPFFQNNYQDVKKRLVSNAIELNIKNLPTKDRPNTFNGAVGNFSLSANIDTSKLETNEAITLKLILKGKGNIDLVDNLNVKFPADFDIFDPKTSDNIYASENSIYGTKTFEYLIIPRSAGNFKIKPIVFTYFDPQKRKYINEQTPEYDLNIKKGKNVDSGAYYSGTNSSEIKYLGKDIRHIKLNPFPIKRKGEYFFGSWMYYLCLIIPLIIMIIIVNFTFKNRNTKGNKALMRHKMATKLAKQKLKKAKVFMDNDEENKFYNEIANGLWGYVSDKFNIQGSELSKDKIHESLQEQNVNNDLIQQFVSILNDCEYARYAPGDPKSKMDEIYSKGVQTIINIESELK